MKIQRIHQTLQNLLQRRGQASKEKYWVVRGLRIYRVLYTKIYVCSFNQGEKKQVTYTRNTVEQYRPIDSGTRTLADRN